MDNSADGFRAVSPCRQILFASLFLAFLLTIVYWNSFECSWHFDDAPNITNNTPVHLNTLSWDAVRKAMVQGHLGSGASPRPLAYLSFGLNYFFGELNVFGYHVVNLLIHFFASLFLFLFIRTLLNLEALSSEYAAYSYPVALIAAALWAVHPIQTQAVTYIVQRMTSLAGLFTIMSLYFYLKGRTSFRPIHAAVLFASCQLAFLAALGSKENALLLPLSIGLCEALLLRGKASWLSAKKGKLLAAVLGITGLIAFLWLSLGKGDSFSDLFAGYDHRPFTLWQRLLTESRVVLFYVSLLLYPVADRLSLVHGFQISTSLLNPVSTLLSVLTLLGIAGLLVAAAKKNPLFSFCFLFYFVNHLMESTVLPLELVYEHRNYVPSMLFFVPFVVGTCWLLRRFRANRAVRTAPFVFGALTLALFAHATYERNQVWKNPQTLWLDTLRKAPMESRVHHNLAAAYQGAGHLAMAADGYEKALSLNNYPRKREEAATYSNLGDLHRDLRDPARAEYFYQRALQVDSDCYPALNSLAVLYESMGKTEAVLPLLKRALEVSPQSPHTNYNLGLFYLKNGEPEKAVSCFLIASGDPQLRHSVLVSSGVAYKQIRQWEKAAGFFEQALATNPKDITPRLHLLSLYHGAALESRAVAQAEALMDILLAQDGLFTGALEFVLSNGWRKEVDLSPEVILPILHQVLSKRCDSSDSRLTYLKKLLDKEGKIE